MRVLLLPIAALLGIQLAQGQDLKNGVTGIFVRKAEIVEVVDTDLLREFTVGDSLLGLRLTFRRYLNAGWLKPSLRTAFYKVHYATPVKRPCSASARTPRPYRCPGLAASPGPGTS